MNIKHNTTKTIVGTSAAAIAVAGLLASSTGIAQADPVGPGCAAYAAQNPVGPALGDGHVAGPRRRGRVEQPDAHHA